MKQVLMLVLTDGIYLSPDKIQEDSSPKVANEELPEID